MSKVAEAVGHDAGREGADAEMTEHLGHERHRSIANEYGNTRKGHSRKTLKDDVPSYASRCHEIGTAASSPSRWRSARRACAKAQASSTASFLNMAVTNRGVICCTRRATPNPDGMGARGASLLAQGATRHTIVRSADNENRATRKGDPIPESPSGLLRVVTALRC